MALPSSSGARFRQRKISVKQSLQLLKQRDIPDLETEDQQRELQHIETGVEKGEEDEHHLQQVIHASEAKFKGGKVDQVYIPTPDASKVWKDASKYYNQKFHSPISYIKFSATVEDTSGIAYNMDEIDEEFLNAYNLKQKNDDLKLSDDDFELLMDKFETTINEKQPFLTMDPTQILSFKEIKSYVLNPPATDPSVLANSLAKKLHIDSFHTILESESHRNKPIKFLMDKIGESVYPHWKDRRIKRGGKPVFPVLKFEDRNQKDDSNPYTTFRRREIRQTRKTRRTDVQSIEKLKQFFKDIKRMNNFVTLVAEKETQKMTTIKARFELFQKRNNYRIQKRTEKDSNISDEVFNLPKKLTLLPIEEILQSEKNALLKRQEMSNNKGSSNDQSLSNHNRKNNGNHQNDSHKRSSNQKISQKSTQQPSANTSIQPYVKLPPAKVPDLDLTTVNTVLLDKHENIRKAVMDKLKKRRDGDKGWINFTDDPYNPYFDMSLNDDGNIQQLSHFPCSAIISSLFEVENSRYINFSDNFNLHTFYSSTDNDIVRINANDGQMMKNDRKTALPEYYDITGETSNINEFGMDKEEIVDKFNNRNRLNVSEIKMKLRKRKGRFGDWVDRKRVTDDDLFEEYLNLSDAEDSELDSKMDIDSEVDSEVVSESAKSKKRRRNIYDCKSDAKKRLKSRFIYDRDLPIINTIDPSTLNRIGKQAQVIRFGSMLSKKAYDNMTSLRAKQYNQLQQMRQQQLSQKKSTSASETPPAGSVVSNSLKQNKSLGTPTPVPSGNEPVKIKEEPATLENTSTLSSA